MWSIRYGYDAMILQAQIVAAAFNGNVMQYCHKDTVCDLQSNLMWNSSLNAGNINA